MESSDERRTTNEINEKMYVCSRFTSQLTRFSHRGVFVHDFFCLWVVLLRYEMVFSAEIRFTIWEREMNCISKSEGKNWCSCARYLPVASQPQRLHVEHHDSRLLHGRDCKSLREGSDAQGRWVGDLRDEEDEFQWLFGCTE